MDITPEYCTPEDVAETVMVPDFRFDTRTHPTYDAVIKLIKGNEERIDRRLGRSWREHRVIGEENDLNTYWRDINAFRNEYYEQGGLYVELHKDVCKWNPEPVLDEEGNVIYPGDKLEIATRGDDWQDISHTIKDGEYSGPWGFHIDYNSGFLYLRTRMFQRTKNSVRITYRWGRINEAVPWPINRLCCLMTAKQIINAQPYLVKVAMGGDVGQAKADMFAEWDKEIEDIFEQYRTPATVRAAW